MRVTSHLTPSGPAVDDALRRFLSAGELERHQPRRALAPRIDLIDMPGREQGGGHEDEAEQQEAGQRPRIVGDQPREGPLLPLRWRDLDRCVHRYDPPFTTSPSSPFEAANSPVDQHSTRRRGSVTIHAVRRSPMWDPPPAAPRPGRPPPTTRRSTMSDATNSSSPNGRFDGTRIFVTGAASGIGAATVELLRGEGASVVGVDVSAADRVAHCDVTDPASVSSAMAAAVGALGGLDVCVNVAGINRFSRIEELSVDLLQAHLSVNL